MLLLDVTIVNVALPSIERALGANFSDLQWVIDAYALTLAGLLLAAGSLADKVGRRLVFMAGIDIPDVQDARIDLLDGTERAA
jgi:MFS family permease